MSYLYTSQDGRMSSDNIDFIRGYENILSNNKQLLNKRILYLRSIGVKALHPDDGWVDRKNNIVQLTYPRFRERYISVGDKIALGQDTGRYRIVRVTAIADWYCNERFYFEPIVRNKKVKSFVQKIFIHFKLLIRKIKKI